MTAVRNGRSVDTSMGFTPLEGVPMATRSGSVDPGALLHLLRVRACPSTSSTTLLEHESGLLGLSGLTRRRRASSRHATAPEAAAALAHYAYRIATAVGAMAVALGGLDALAFTGGVGEHSSRVRAAVCAHLACSASPSTTSATGLSRATATSARPGSHPRVVVVAAREEVVIAREVRALLGD